MIIIAESGATKTDWCAAAPGKEPVIVKTAGMNLATMSDEAIGAIVLEAADAFRKAGVTGGIEEIHYYVAGLIVGEGEKVPPQAVGLDKVFRGLFPEAEIEYASDLLDAARAVCGHAPGIAAILGTGSNLCFYDGTAVSQPVRSGGYIIGDEGGGAVLGKLFLADYIKGLVPEPVASEFSSSHDATYEGIVNFVYKSPAPASALGSLAPWLLERYDNPYVKGLIDRNFQAFIDRSLSHCDTTQYPVGVVGGWGYACRDIFTRLCAAKGIKTGRFEPEPISGLLKYHL